MHMQLFELSNKRVCELKRQQESEIEIEWIELYFDVAEDSTLVRIIEIQGNKYNYFIEKQDRSKNISGIAVLKGKLKKQEENKELYGARVMYFEFSPLPHEKNQ